MARTLFFFGVLIFMYMIRSSAAFDSAHFLAGYNGKCANIHGHHWVIEVSAYSETVQQSGEKRGMIIDFGDFKREIRALADSFDHALIYEKGSFKPATVDALNDEGFRMIEVGYRPTAENFAKNFFDMLTLKGLTIKSVTVYETPDNCAVDEEG